MQKIQISLCTLEHDLDDTRNQNQPKNHNVGRFFYLSQEEYAAFLVSNNTLLDFRNENSLLYLVFWNYEEYFHTYNLLLDAFIRTEKTYPKDREPAIELNRCLINFLGTSYSYLEHTKKRLKQKYGESSDIFKKAIELTNDGFDNLWSYRFIYNLRHYSQHGGLPITGLNFHSELDSSPSIQVSVSRDKLLSAGFFTWKSSIREDMKNELPNIDIHYHLNTFFQFLNNFAHIISEIELEYVKESANFINNLLRRVPPCEFGGKMAVLKEIFELNENDVEQSYLPSFHFIDTELICNILNDPIFEKT